MSVIRTSSRLHRIVFSFGAEDVVQALLVAIEKKADLDKHHFVSADVGDYLVDGDRIEVIFEKPLGESE